MRNEILISRTEAYCPSARASMQAFLAINAIDATWSKAHTGFGVNHTPADGPGGTS